MRILYSNPALAFMLLFATAINALAAQTKGIVLDESTRLPIPYVSIYTANTDNVRATISDQNGAFQITAQAQALTFSHISYHKRTLEKSSLSDTILLTPADILLPEILIGARPEWIVKKLREAVKQKKRSYRTQTKDFAYRYQTYALGDFSGYAFYSSGSLRIPTLASGERYLMEAKQNIIKYKDSTAGTDFSNLQGILYEDFILGFNNKFIRENSFSQNLSFEDDSLVQLLFTNKKYPDASGYLILDTLNNVIVEVEQNLGTDYNLKTKMNAILRSYATGSLGISYPLFNIKVKTTYKKSGSSYYLAQCKYKWTQKTVFENKKFKGAEIRANEAQLFVDNEAPINPANMIVLPKLEYIYAIETKKMRQEYAALQNLPKVYQKF